MIGRIKKQAKKNDKRNETKEDSVIIRKNPSINNGLSNSNKDTINRKRVTSIYVNNDKMTKTDSFTKTLTRLKFEKPVEKKEKEPVEQNISPEAENHNHHHIDKESESKTIQNGEHSENQKSVKILRSSKEQAAFQELALALEELISTSFISCNKAEEICKLLSKIIDDKQHVESTTPVSPRRNSTGTSNTYESSIKLNAEEATFLQEMSYHSSLLKFPSSWIDKHFVHATETVKEQSNSRFIGISINQTVKSKPITGLDNEEVNILIRDICEYYTSSNNATDSMHVSYIWFAANYYKIITIQDRLLKIWEDYKQNSEKNNKQKGFNDLTVFIKQLISEGQDPPSATKNSTDVFDRFEEVVRDNPITAIQRLPRVSLLIEKVLKTFKKYISTISAKDEDSHRKNKNTLRLIQEAMRAVAQINLYMNLNTDFNQLELSRTSGAVSFIQTAKEGIHVARIKNEKYKLNRNNFDDDDNQQFNFDKYQEFMNNSTELLKYIKEIHNGDYRGKIKDFRSLFLNLTKNIKLSLVVISTNEQFRRYMMNNINVFFYAILQIRSTLELCGLKTEGFNLLWDGTYNKNEGLPRKALTGNVDKHFNELSIYLEEHVYPELSKLKTIEFKDEETIEQFVVKINKEVSIYTTSKKLSLLSEQTRFALAQKIESHCRRNKDQISIPDDYFIFPQNVIHFFTLKFKDTYERLCKTNNLKSDNPTQHLLKTDVFFKPSPESEKKEIKGSYEKIEKMAQSGNHSPGLHLFTHNEDTCHKIRFENKTDINNFYFAYVRTIEDRSTKVFEINLQTHEAFLNDVQMQRARKMLTKYLPKEAQSKNNLRRTRSSSVRLENKAITKKLGGM